MDIDVVILWVDGSDPAWLAQKQEYLPPAAADSNSANRYRDWGILPYWFRAIETFAPWVRKIHFVTWGHVPGFLNLDAPKLHVVRHDEFIPAEYLPTFSSHTIEMNIHRIPGLAEHFVYFNDDMFLTHPVEPEDFFQDGLPRDVFALDAIYCATGSAGSYNCADMEIINDHFDKRTQFRKHWRKWLQPCYTKAKLYRTLALLPWRWFPGFYYQHLPSNFLKSTLHKVWGVAETALDETCRNRFRGKGQVNQWVFKFWQLAEGSFMPLPLRWGHCFHLRDKGVEGLCSDIEQRRYKLICINDTDQTTDFEGKKTQIAQAFDRILPEKSGFEL